ncbi:MAG: hypothetical protein RL274_217 [Pseudomonadota bacterium]|jgi:predicted phosphodiesterase
MKWLVPVLLTFAATGVNAAGVAWVQAAATGYEARLATAAAVCPSLSTDTGDVAMTVRAPASEIFPLVCAAPIPMGSKSASIVGQALAVPVADPQRILVLGDTGCRIKGAALQACNDPVKWPFPALAASAAKLNPDLVVHLGDYLYRESPCPPGVAGCAGSPWGDNWTTWLADFYTPAAPLLAAAPIVLVRGNHEDCERAWQGWQRALSAFGFSPACAPHEPLFTVDIGAVRLAVMDDATASEISVNKTDLPVYAAEIASLANIPVPVWFVHHRPIWAAITGPLGIPAGGNRTLIAAAIAAGGIAAAGDTLIPGTVALQLSGHIHSFEALNYDKDVPPQIVAGNGGDNLHVTPQNLWGTVFLGVSRVRVTDGLSVDGFGFLLMTKAETGWIIDLYDSDGHPTRQCRFLAPSGGKQGRVNCPLK